MYKALFRYNANLSRRGTTPSLSAPSFVSSQVPTAEGLCWVKDLLWIHDFGSILGCHHGDHVTTTGGCSCVVARSHHVRRENMARAVKLETFRASVLTNLTSVSHTN